MGPFAANLSMVDAQLALQALGIACAVAGLAIALSVAEIRRMHERADRNLALKTEELRSHEVQLATALAELQLVDVRKDNFLSVLAHELLNPVGALINGHALLDQDMPKEQHLAVRAMMDRQISLLTMLSADLMDLARVKAGKVRLEFEAVSILQVATAAADSVRDKFERKVQVLATEFPDTDLEVRGDSKRLTQVVVNLLSNASRHCPEGTQVRIRAVARGDVVAIEIADNGPGIAQERISHIFNLYEQVDRDASEGLGLGLALSHQLIALHNGNLRVSSELAVGTVFVIELPRLTQR
jgi:signal transduction histidine kinase